MEPFLRFTRGIRRSLGKRVVSIIAFGSLRGVRQPTMSDIDLLVITKQRTDIPDVLRIIRAAERRTFHIVHSPLANFLQRQFLCSNDFCGVHLIPIAQQEFDSQFRPKSMRLKLLTALLVSEPLFLATLRKRYRVLVGKDMLSGVRVRKPTHADRIRIFTLPFLILVLLPLTCWNGRAFRVWCLKVSKYYLEAMETYAQLCGTPCCGDAEAQRLVTKYRYAPLRYPGSAFGLYARTWWHLFQNLPFIWRS